MNGFKIRPENFEHYKTHNILIDTQHWELLKLLTELNNMVEPHDLAEICRRVSELLDLLELHSEVEEKMMTEVSYPSVHLHTEKHEEMAEMFLAAVKHTSSIFVCGQLDGFLKYLTRHIEEHDFEYIHWMLNGTLAHE